MEMDTWQIWLIIALMGIGTYLIRFSFLGLLGGRDMSPWVLRHLRYTAVAILPALITPLVLWPQATGGQPEPARLSAAAAVLAVGYVTKNAIAAITAGLVVLYGLMALLG